MPFISVVSGKNALYIGGQWNECSLDQLLVDRISFYWWPVGRMPFILVVSERMLFTLLVSEE